MTFIPVLFCSCALAVHYQRVQHGDAVRHSSSANEYGILRIYPILFLRGFTSFFLCKRDCVLQFTATVAPQSFEVGHVSFSFLFFSAHYFVSLQS